MISRVRFSMFQKAANQVRRALMRATRAMIHKRLVKIKPATLIPREAPLEKA